MTLLKTTGDKKVNLDFNKEFINTFSEKILTRDIQFINQTLNNLHASDVANLIENLTNETRIKLIELEEFSIDPDIFIELNESIQSEVLQLLSIDSITKIIKRLESDDSIKILENLEKEKKTQILEKLPPKDKFLLEEGLSYPEDSAARIMQREFTAVPNNWSVGQTIDYLRENKDLPKEFLEIFIVDNEFKPVGTVPSSRVLRTSRDSKMSSIMTEMPVLISVNMDKEEVGHTFENYNLVSAGVVNKDNKLVGMITADDVVTVVQEEAEEDALRLAGVAYSTRNKLLNKRQILIGSKVYKYLLNIKKSSFVNLKHVKKNIVNLGVKKIDYLEIYDLKNHRKLNKFNKHSKIFIAYYLDNIRLIDNI